MSRLSIKLREIRLFTHILLQIDISVGTVVAGDRDGRGGEVTMREISVVGG